MSAVSALKDAINEVRYSPAAIQRQVFDVLEEASNGTLDVLDPSNPFVFLLEASAVTAAAVMIEAESLTRQQYPSMALTEDELYLHMSDYDYLGRFSSPARTTFTVLFNKDELIRRAVQTDIPGMKKLVIPRNTEFKVSDYTFTMEYPIELRVLGHGGLQVVYDGTQLSPLQTLESNLVEWSLVKMENQEYIRVLIPVNQCQLTTQYAHLTLSASYQKTFTFNNLYYACRVWRPVGTGWVEIRTTHTDQVFDPNYPTVLLKVYENQLQVSVPQIYLSNKTLDAELRIDIYNTKGPLDILLDGYAINSFSANWRDIAGGASTKYSAPINAFSSMAVFSDSVVKGGSAALTFPVLRERVIQNALGNAQLPITNVQLLARLANYGYQGIQTVDNVTNRIYLASRHLPPPTSGTTLTGAGCLISLFQATFETLVQSSNVYDNGYRVTLASSATFERENGVIRLLPDSELTALGELTVDQFLAIANTRQFLMTPFHYVLDATNRYFTSRAYYLDAPKLLAREFIEENTSLSLQLSTKNLKVLKTSTGYTLRLVTQSGSIVQAFADEQITVQLSYRPPGERRDVYLNGSLTGLYEGERVYEFSLESQFDLDSEHSLFFTNFSMFPNESRAFGCLLNQQFNIVYYVTGYYPLNTTIKNLTYVGAEYLLLENAIGVMHERVKLHFGDYLEGFWENSRSIIESIRYRTYSEDVPAIYPEVEYQRDPITGAIDISLAEDGTLQYTILHREGDPVLDDTGEVVYAHRKGDPMLDELGNPVPENTRGILQEADIFFIDGRYRYVTQKADKDYLKELPLTIVNWLEEDLKLFRQWALEQTEIHLYPLRTLGSAEATILEGLNRVIDLEQSLSFTFYLSREVYDNAYLRQVLVNTTRQVVADAFLSKRITKNEILSQLTAAAGENAIAIDFNGLGGYLNLSALTLVQDNERCAIRKRLERHTDGSIRIVDSLSIQFLQHEV